MPEHIAICAATVQHGWFCTLEHVLFLLIGRSVCIIQNNQILDVFVKYIANYHILYSVQLDIRLSVLVI